MPIDWTQSSTYMATIETGVLQGRILEGITVMLILGTERFGSPTTKQLQKLHSITSHNHMKVFYQRILTANSWEEFLAT